MKASIRVEELMDRTGVRFGTSGARGLVTEMTDQVCYVYTRGFLQALEAAGELSAKERRVAVAGDLRSSTDRIMEAVFRAVEDAGYQPLNGGKIPSPAVAFYGFVNRIPSIMVTGSHIPNDRNGIKFNKCSGEVLKDDEPIIRRQAVSLGPDLFNAAGGFRETAGRHWPVVDAARRAYLARYVDLLDPDALEGCRIGVYQHSAVGRDLLVELLESLGAELTPLARSDRFIPVDTEAIRPEDIHLAQQWAREHHFDAIVSTDGDSDRPLIADEGGRWLRGDMAGILCARFLGADSVCTPVNCNSAVEKCDWFREVRRTRIGSPYVIASMAEATEAGAKCVVGYEANGGFLLGSEISFGRGRLRALPTRDAVIILLSLLLLSRREGRTLSQLAAALPPRFTASDRLEGFPTERSQALLRRFDTGAEGADRAAIASFLGQPAGGIVRIDRTDGLRITFANDEVVHLRPSGNAPEFRCYTEAGSPVRAAALNAECLQRVRDWA